MTAKTLKPYPKYKDSEIWCLDRVPVNWDVYRVKNLFKLREEKNYAPLSEVNLISVYTALGVIQHDEIENTTGNKAVNADGYKIVYPNDIVVNIILCWMGAIGYSQFQGVTSPAYDVYCPIKDLNIRYYNYYFRTSLFTGECYRRGKGIMAMRWRTYSDQFTDIKIPHPPRSEQDDIVAYLDDKTAKIDRLIGLYKREIELLKERRQAVIHKAVTRGLDDKVKLKDSGVSWIGLVPREWEVKRLKHQVHLIKDKADNNDNYIGLENIEGWSGKYINASSDYPPEGISIKIESGDILFGKLRPYLAKCYIVNNEKCCSTEFFVLRCYLNNKYLSYMMRSPIFINDVNMSTYGTKMPRTNWDYVGNMSIPLPPRPEQDDIVAYLDDQCAKIDVMIGKVQSKIGLLEEYRVRLISDVVTGKVRVGPAP